jgi:hypothetical protein
VLGQEGVLSEDEARWLEEAGPAWTEDQP